MQAFLENEEGRWDFAGWRASRLNNGNKHNKGGNDVPAFVTEVCSLHKTKAVTLQYTRPHQSVFLHILFLKAL